MTRKHISLVPLLGILLSQNPAFGKNASNSAKKQDLTPIERKTTLQKSNYSFSENEQTPQIISTIFDSITNYEPSFMKNQTKFANFIKRNHDKSGKDLLQAAVVGLSLNVIDKYTPIDVQNVKNFLHKYTYHPIGFNQSYGKITTSMPFLAHRCTSPSLYEEIRMQNIDCNSIENQSLARIEKPQIKIGYQITMYF